MEPEGGADTPMEPEERPGAPVEREGASGMPVDPEGRGHAGRGVRRVLASGVTVLLLSWVSAAAMAAAFADRLIFIPPAPSYEGTEPGYLRLETDEGDRVAALLVGPEDAERVVLYAHGNAEDLGYLRPMVEEYARRLAVRVLAVEYPGYGASTGQPTEKGAYAAADAAWRYATDSLGAAAEDLVAHGRSLGGAVMADLASRRPVGGLVLESTFVSAYRVMTRVRLLPIDQFETLKKLRGFRTPTLLIHGTRDQVVGFWHGERLRDELGDAVAGFYRVEGAGHNDLMLVAGEEYWRRLGAFLAGLRDG